MSIGLALAIYVLVGHEAVGLREISNSGLADCLFLNNLDVVGGAIWPKILIWR